MGEPDHETSLMCCVIYFLSYLCDVAKNVAAFSRKPLIIVTIVPVIQKNLANIRDQEFNATVVNKVDGHDKQHLSLRPKTVGEAISFDAVTRQRLSKMPAEPEWTFQTGPQMVNGSNACQCISSISYDCDGSVENA